MHLSALVNNPLEGPSEDDVARFHLWVNQLTGLGYQVDDFRFDPRKDLYGFRNKRMVRSDLPKVRVEALTLTCRFEQEQTRTGFDAPRVR